MQDFLTFASSILSMVSTFLLTEPICYFFGLFLLLGVVGIVRNILRL